MSNSYSLIFNIDEFPKNAEIEAFARSIETSFRLDPSFNFLQDKGFCPCKYKRKKQGFEWDCRMDINTGKEAQGEVIFRSDAADAICAVLAGASIAFLSNGGLEFNNTLLYGRDLVTYARDEIAAYTEQLDLLKSSCQGRPEEALLLALVELKNVKVKQLIQVDQDMSDPLISVVFPNNSRLMGKRWTLNLIDGFTFTTQDLPVYRLSNTQMDYLKSVVSKISTMMLNDPILDSHFDEATLSITIHFKTGALIFHPNSTYMATDEESKIFLNINQQWEFLDSKKKNILPDLKSQKLVYL